MPDELPYRLGIAPELEAFRPEIEYACDFLDRCHFVRRREGADRMLHYGPAPPPGAMAVPAALFPAAVRIDGDGIHPDPAGLARLEAGKDAIPLLPDRATGVASGETSLAYDALGLIFFMLSRVEERGDTERDSYGRFPFGGALAVRAGCYADPVADRAARDLAALLRGERRPENRTKFSLRLTHDVDRLKGYHRVHEPLRFAVGDLVKRARPAAAWRRIRDGYLAGEPWRSVRGLMDLSERHGQTSRFFFMGPSDKSMDSPYAATMAGLLKRVAGEVAARGHSIGFHPGYATESCGEEWRRQRDGLEAIVGRPVREGRQHVLGYRADATPDIWDDSGMAADYTPAFPEASGFRTGTCRGHAAYSLRRRRKLTLVQHSTAVLDFGLFGGKYRDLTQEAALEECISVTEPCRDYGGTLVVLYHTGQTRPRERRFYEALLERIA